MYQHIFSLCVKEDVMNAAEVNPIFALENFHYEAFL